MTGHVHAESMKLYAEDAAKMAMPWKRWQYKNDVSDEVWQQCVVHPSWDTSTLYRHKPRTIKIGDMEVPEPLRHYPKNGTMVYYVNMVATHGVSPTRWDLDSAMAKIVLHRGLMHLSESDAKAHARALLEFTRP